MTGLTETECLVAALDAFGCATISLRASDGALIFHLHQRIGDCETEAHANANANAEDGDWLIVMRQVPDTAVIEAMSLCFRLTAKEAEVLYWVVKGKTNKDIGEILGSSPMTVKKHLERIFVKLGSRRAPQWLAWR